MSDIKTLIDGAYDRYKLMNGLPPTYLIINQFDWFDLLIKNTGKTLDLSIDSKGDYYKGIFIVKTGDKHFRNNPKFVTE